ncbi:sugar transferase [Rhodobacteraceae bacterium M385]|nr:sugar transferase [Rhodobacteraceae bacterium M385]
MKRLFDIILSLLLLPLALIVTLIYECLCRIRGEGTGIFTQTRVGKDQIPFTLYKLRTMLPGTAQKASHEISTAQITPLGRVMRRTKIDELPQILNVLLGDMSFVGPRPCLPNQHELIFERAERDVFLVRPGVTGPAQLLGIDMSTPRKLAQADADYIKTQSFGEDMSLLMKTAIGGGRGDAAKN